jgi:hypothetical protein
MVNYLGLWTRVLGEEKMEPVMAQLEASFVKLKGEDIKYYIQRYLIILSRDSKKSTVDVDLHELSCGLKFPVNPEGLL